MPTLLDADGCCGTCDSVTGCAFSFDCACHKPRGPLSPEGASLAGILLAPYDRQIVEERSLRDLNAAAREVPFDRFVAPEYDE